MIYFMRWDLEVFKMSLKTSMDAVLENPIFSLVPTYLLCSSKLPKTRLVTCQSVIFILCSAHVIRSAWGSDLLRKVQQGPAERAL